MNRQKWLILLLALGLIGLTGGMLGRLGGHQRLGRPGVKSSPLADSIKVNIQLPEEVAGYTSEAIPVEKIAVDVLPKDTSFGQRRYTAADGFWSQISVVLMGTDRTSIHKPQFCLEGGGWKIDSAASRAETVHVERPRPYDLPVMKFISSKTVTVDGQPTSARGIYVFWFIADNEYTASHWERMWWMARDMFRTGVLQRWAYVSFFSVCAPGQEEATFERMKKLIAAAVPEFQLTPAPVRGAVTAQR